MKVFYRGYEIEVRRIDSILYCTVYRVRDNYECVDYFENTTETVHQKIKSLKNIIDEEFKSDDPWGEMTFHNLILKEPI